MEWLEILIPLVIAFLYFFGGHLFGRKDQDPEPEAGQFDRGGHGDEEDDLTAEDRRIQEEIRRKILERQQGRGSQEVAPAPAPVMQRQEDRTSGAGGQERGQKTVREDSVRRVESWRETRDNLEETQRRAVIAEATSTQDAEHQQRRITELQQHAEQLRSEARERMRTAARSKDQKAYRVTRRTGRGSPSTTQRKPNFHREVVDALYDTRQFRKAFLTLEILGTPVGLRRQGKIGPLWEQ